MIKPRKNTIIAILLVPTLLVLLYHYQRLSEPRIDARNYSTIIHSIDAMGETLPDSEQIKFGRAVRSLMESNITDEDKKNPIKNSYEFMEKYMSKYDGWTRAQLMAEWEVVHQKQMEADKAQTLAAITEVENRQNTQASAQMLLATMEVVSAHLINTPSADLNTLIPALEVTVKNNFNQPVSRLFLHALLTQPEASAPVLDKIYNQPMDSSFLPGQTAVIKIPLSDENSLGQLQDPDKLALVVTIVKMADTQDNIIADASIDSAQDTQHLLELKNHLAEIQ